MKNLYITGAAGGGKTTVALGIALKLKKEGYKVSYFKPVGNRLKLNGSEDNDTLLMREILKMEDDVKIISPFIAGISYFSGLKNQEFAIEGIKEAYKVVNAGNDLVIIEGAAFPYAGAACGLDAVNLASQLNAFVLNVIKIKNDFSVDKAIFLNNYFTAKGLNAIGHIFNNVPRQLLSKTKGVYQQILESTGCENYGIIPMRPEFASPTVSEYYETLGGELLTGEDKLDQIVEEVIVGAMTTESALQYMRRLANKAVIIGGDRADLALATLETNTSALILTGGLYPDVKVVSRAAEKGVTVILVRDDTYTTIEKISKVARHIRSDDTTGINIAVENIVQYCDWQKIIKSLEN
ncbi:Phosphate acetyltransferase [Pelotomaculum sp. FP]|uniref:phosphotransacetylase family protein n=1 Tax=Pelotomaculum sp. FP TaxID=261474 RepID=UPI0010651F64|nr:DRTGG domain-containing protein [Pelotomaculum sp. FP]TEB10313.1 Phosphate acetyltransferase [Pelotomaculum sp. FP]